MASKRDYQTPPRQPLKRKPGRPAHDAAEKAEPRSVRLNETRWGKLQRLGREWLEMKIDAAPDPADVKTKPGKTAV